MSQDLSSLIQRKEAEFSPYYIRMEQLKANFIDETISFASESYRTIAKEYVSKNAEHVLGMGNEVLLRMKAKIKILIGNTEKTVKEVLNNPVLWWHLRPNSISALNQYLQLDDKHPIILDQAVRQILGYLGEILEEFHFRVTVRGNYGSFAEFWYNIPEGGSLVPYYPHLFKWSIKMQEIIKQYNNQYLEAITIYKEIELLKDQQKKELALSRWDSF
jgi:hypothetical protein